MCPTGLTRLVAWHSVFRGSSANGGGLFSAVYHLFSWLTHPFEPPPTRHIVSVSCVSPGDGCRLLSVSSFFFVLARRMEAYRNSMLHNKDAFEGKTVRIAANSLWHHRQALISLAYHVCFPRAFVKSRCTFFLKSQSQFCWWGIELLKCAVSYILGVPHLEHIAYNMTPYSIYVILTCFLLRLLWMPCLRPDVVFKACCRV